MLIQLSTGLAASLQCSQVFCASCGVNEFQVHMQLGVKDISVFIDIELVLETGIFSHVKSITDVSTESSQQFKDVCTSTGRYEYEDS